MLIMIAVTAVFTLLFTLMNVINIPMLPPEVFEFFQMAMEYMGAGAGILANYVNMTYLAVLFGIVVAVDVGVGLYHLVMWIIRKIPILGID